MVRTIVVLGQDCDRSASWVAPWEAEMMEFDNIQLRTLVIAGKSPELAARREGGVEANHVVLVLVLPL